MAELKSSEHMMTAISFWTRSIDDEAFRATLRDYLGALIGPIHSEVSEGKVSKPKITGEAKKQYEIVMGYLSLLSTMESFRQCEFYFRRYPFRGLPVTRRDHMGNLCDMYFFRIYEFREKLKGHLVRIKSPSRRTILNNYAKHFEQEISARNFVTHEGSFSSMSLDKIFTLETLWEDPDVPGKDPFRRMKYREEGRAWARRVRTQAKSMESLLEDVSRETLKRCEFLSRLTV